jgi:protein-S-isoprenylcysteine O-methyltransferase Ste14
MTAPRRRALAYGVVLVQAGLLWAIFFGPSGPDREAPSWRRGLGASVELAGGAALVLAVASLGRSSTPLPTPSGRSTLKTGGLYRWVRHPIYAAVIALAVGRTIAAGSLFDAALTTGLVGLFAGKSCWEEQMLRARYPAYASYAAKTPRFFPAPWRRRRSR